MSRPQVDALTPPHRAAELRRKFGVETREVAQAFEEVRAPSGQILGAIVLLARRQGDIHALANAYRAALAAATVKEERG
ncbi:hypothetical protein GCM10022631_27670 [Deinococcus rubellus]|uniref:Uncharacterized protein n=1 Tax=Deinococcus rubellus TaxID=1889240 RepID=A0ABY5YEU8_9DEIO|nr:hypothetical protein [Deinococcus rubellus]UWX62917.1 hypothetical protein N0D28_09065 [Deinococcus rubellus]